MMTTTRPLHSIVLLLLILSSYCSVHHATEVATSSSLGPWKKSSFPNPSNVDSTNDGELCRSPTSSRVCDPDAILSDRSVLELGRGIERFEESHAVLMSCDGGGPKIKIIHPPADHSQNAAVAPVQLAVALVERMDLSDYSHSKNKEDNAAEAFATHLHDTWGVGTTLDDDTCGGGGGTGILLFLSLGDRVIYISKGSALNRILTDSRLDRVIDNMRPLLRTAKFQPAIEQALDEIGQHLKLGEPKYHERVYHWLEQLFPVILFGGMVGVAIFSDRARRIQQRDYARVQSQLTELDRSRAEALQGRYQCTSCPICLQDFQEQQYQGVEGESSVEGTTGTEATSELTNSTATTKLGSDGLPLRLLRCGHVFDETCWNDWVESGTGRVDRCPICQQHVGSETDEGVVVVQNDAAVDHNRGRNIHVNIRQRRHEDLVQRALRNYTRERAFRLMALNQRYPQYARVDQIQRWSQSTYDGELARDPSFVRSKPQTSGSGSSGRSGSSGVSFGGGRSGGGRGGRW